jgi:hypothetical protein
MTATTATVSGRTTTVLSSATNTISLPGGIVVLTSAGLNNRYALHDCASVGQAQVTNCVWPLDYDSPAAGNPPGSALVFNNGITVMTAAGESGALGSFQLIYT